MRFRLIILLALTAAVSAQPYEPHVIWDRSGQTDSSAYGYKILPLGDQNDDGFADWAVLANGNVATYHGTRASYLEFFYGGPTPSTTPNYVLYEDSTLYYRSWFATEAGDLNGDGYVDWLVYYWPLSNPATRIYRFSFGGHGFPGNADILWPSATGFRRMGDFNGDGFDDLYTYDVSNVGRMYYGGNPMDTIPDWTIHQPPAGLNQTIPYAVGDFNGDGASDFICFNMNNGNLAIFLGGANPDTIPAYFWSNMTGPNAGIDSLNGDNAAEIERSGVYINFGRPVLNPIPDAYLNSICGSYAADAGDFNGDGYHDLILYTWSTLDNPLGALDLHLGHPWLNPDPVFTIEGDTPPLNLRGIYTAIGLGDINGDHLSDIAIGAWHDWFAWRGRCVIISGDTLHVSAHPARPELPTQIAIDVYPNPFNGETTIKLTLPWSERLNEMTIYNALGQTVRHEMLPPFVGQVTYGFDARELPSGTYFLLVHTGSLSQTRKLILIR
jgi:hypothetical protein